MTEPPDARDDATSLLDTLRNAAPLASLLAAAMYGYGWLVVTAFYGRFGVRPEEVGFGFGELTVRVAVFALEVLAVALLVGWGLRRLGDLHVPRNAVGLVLSVLALVGLIVGTAVVGGTDLAILGFSLLALVVANLTERLTDRGGTMPLRRPAAVASALLAVLGLTLLVGSAFVIPDAMANDVEGGRDRVHLSPLPGVTVFDIRKVMIETPGVRGTFFDEPTCVHLLGSSGSLTVVFLSGDGSVTDDGEEMRGITVRVPTESTRIWSPCPEPSDAGPPTD